MENKFIFDILAFILQLLGLGEGPTNPQDLCDCGVRNSGTKIVGGEAADPNEFPWQISIRISNSHACGGSLISEKWVVTAGHCVDGRPVSTLTVVVGEHRLSDSVDSGVSKVHGVRRIKVHPSYNANKYDNDIALLELDTSIEFSKYVNPVCLPKLSNQALNNGDDMIISGWGNLFFGGNQPDILQKAVVSYITTNSCEDDYSYTTDEITSNMICAAESGIDSCQGDSGGPMVRANANSKHFLFGIVSWGKSCAIPFFPGVYTKVINYIDWIEDQTSTTYCNFN